MPRVKHETNLRRSLRLILVAWIFGAFWQWTINGAAMTRFARGLETPDWAFALLAVIPPLAGILQLPASILLERFGRRKFVFILAQTIARATWVVIAAIPWVLPNSEHLWWPLMMIVVFISWSGAHLGTPAWMNWMSDLIPHTLRGRYFGLRNRLGQIVGIIATLAIGAIMDVADHLGATTGLDAGRLMLMTTSVLIALAGLVGVLDIQCFARVPDATAPAGKPQINWGKFLTQPLLDTSFRWYLAYNFTLWLGIGALGQYLWLYLFDVAMLSNRTANFMMVALPLVGFAAAYPVWGRLIDRTGCKPILVICSLLSAFFGLGWILIQPDMLWLPYLFVFMGMLIWPGVEIANFNMLLGIAGSGKGGGAYVACTAVVVGLGGILSGVVAGVLAAVFVDQAWQIKGLGLDITLTYHSLIIFFSVAMRLACVPLAMRIVEPKAHPTEEVIKYMSSTMHSNFRAIILMPNRLVTQLARRTYRGA